MKKFVKFTASVGTVWLIFVLIMFPQSCIDAGLKGVFLCLDTVIPSLFPFFVCSGLITGLGLIKPIEWLFAPFMKPLFGVSGKGAMPFVLGILSGYPVGAKCVTDLYSKGEISKKEAEKLLAFCNNSGPMFILGAVGVTMAQSVALGRYLYIIHILSALITGIILKLYKSGESEAVSLPLLEKQGFIKTIIDSFASATDSIISVCGFVILFSVAGEAIPKIFASPVLHGLLEITGGAEKILNMPADFNVRISVLSGIIAFSGFSVMLQVSRIISKTNLSPRLFFMGKTLQGFIGYALSVTALRFYHISRQTFSLDVIKPTGIWGITLAVTAAILLVLGILKKKAVDN